MSRPSSPRFRSQAFSTSQRFPGRPKLRGLVKPHPFGSFPSESSPRNSRAHLSEPLAPLWLSTCGQRRTARRLVTVCFQPPPLRDGCHFPRRLWAPFRHTQVHLPVTLDLEQQSHLLPLASPTSKPCSSYESVLTGTRSLQNRRPILSWVSAPLKLSPPTPRTLSPARLHE
jgi:hypothetical protein